MPALSLAALLCLSDLPELADPKPYHFNATYYAESWHNLKGGLATGTAFLDKLDLSAGLDGGRLFGLNGVTFFARGFYANGHAVSGSLVGDIQTVSNLETLRAVRVFELWSEWRLGAGGSSTRVGLYDLNSEFDTLPTAQIFLNASQGIGKDVSQSGKMGPSIYPVSSFGVRTIWKIAEEWSAQLAVLDGIPGDPNEPTATTVHISSKDGALLVGEADYIDDVIHKIALGAWHYTAQFDTIGTGTNNTPAATQNGNSGIYGMIDLTLSPPSGEFASRLDGFIRLGYTDADVNRFGTFAGAGLVYSGFLAREDRLGLGVAVVRNGAAYRQALQLLGTPQNTAETNIEASWAFPVNSWLTLQPDLQYVINPNTDPTLQNDLVAGLRAQISWDSSPH